MSLLPTRRRWTPRRSIPAVVAREKDVMADKYRQQGKPEAMIEKIVENGLKTYYKEVCLLDQAFIHDTAKSVAQAVKEAEGKVGAPIKVTGFVRYALGEGIEKADLGLRRRSRCRQRPEVSNEQEDLPADLRRELPPRKEAIASWVSRSIVAS